MPIIVHIIILQNNLYNLLCPKIVTQRLLQIMCYLAFHNINYSYNAKQASYKLIRPWYYQVIHDFGLFIHDHRKTVDWNDVNCNVNDRLSANKSPPCYFGYVRFTNSGKLLYYDNKRDNKRALCSTTLYTFLTFVLNCCFNRGW